MHKESLRAIEAIVARKSAPFETIGVRPLSPVIGAEIEGVDLAGELSNRQFDEVHRAFLEHKVIVFRDQNLSAEAHKNFGRRFGKLHTHVLQAMREGDNERLEVRATGKSKYVAGEDWHSDVTCDEEPPMGSMLYLTETPSIGSGGDTLFANMGLAYEMLSDAMKAFLGRPHRHPRRRKAMDRLLRGQARDTVRKERASRRHPSPGNGRESALRQSRLHDAHCAALAQRKR